MKEALCLFQLRWPFKGSEVEGKAPQSSVIFSGVVCRMAVACKSKSCLPFPFRRHGEGLCKKVVKGRVNESSGWKAISSVTPFDVV